MNFFKSATLIATVILFSACCICKRAHKKNEVNKKDIPVVTNVVQVDPRSQNGKTISLKLNDNFDVVFLRECIGCAEVWTITSIDKDKIIQNASTYKNEPAAGMMGGARDHIFHFTAKEKGVSVISFTFFDEKSTITFDVK
jgi:hypothetical protein